MDHSQPRLAIMVISAFVALLLQIIIAPIIAIAHVVPNFILIAVVITATRNAPVRSTIFGFIMGLIFDLISVGPMGAMTLVLTLLGYAVSSLNKGIFGGGLLIDIVVVLLASLIGELLVSVVYAVVGSDPEFLLSLVIKVLPAALYDSLCGLVLLVIYRFFTGSRSTSTGPDMGRPLRRKLR
ncbi:MAG: rod shape-determining protein MreD [Coriobacteriales bacterium]|jgi:rod shape-determining protein MreD|nr:rod shape-determining protein MreD [Coriobacteriales bacterium]